MSALKARIIAPEGPVKSGKPVTVKIVLTNTGEEDLAVLTWNTPLDKVITDCLVVTLNGRQVAYDGPIVKRAAPRTKDYAKLKAGQSIEADFDVSNAYDTSRPGVYKVRFKTPIADATSGSAPAGSALMAGTHERRPVRIAHQTSFSTSKGVGARLTLGAAARQAEARAKKNAGTSTSLQKKKAAAAAVTGPLPPTLVGGSATRKAATRKAHTDGYALCKAAIASLANDARYREWFGTHSATRFKKVKANYSAVRERMERVPFTYDLTGDGCDDGIFAYTYQGTSTIWYCSAFWSAPAKGTDSKAGTVVHEHTHSDASTDDINYGQEDCRALARKKPARAVKNADSHEYYAGG